MIGANREAVTRALEKLRRRGIIEIRERRIHVVDLEALRRAAQQA
jgi:CRP-like cAMP-binding protein